jgi:hypothetical protein
MGVKLAIAITMGMLFCRASAASAQQSTSSAVEDAVLNRAEKIIKEHRLLTAKQQRCMSLLYRDKSNAKTGKVGVYEVHDKECGGDQDVSHRLFDLEIDMKTGAAKWDNIFPDMEMRPLPKRAR